MRLLLLAFALAASLVSAASAPRAAGAPYVLRQATRKQVIRRLASRRLRNRQSMPSNGVYLTCPSSPTPSGTVYAVIAGANQKNLGVTRPIAVINTQTALECTEYCVGTQGCFASQWTLTANPDADQNCQLYNTYTGADPSNDGTATFRGYSCSAFQAESAVGDYRCCNYYSG